MHSTTSTVSLLTCLAMKRLCVGLLLVLSDYKTVEKKSHLNVNVNVSVNK